MTGQFARHILAEADELDDWDRFVDESPQGCIFCRSWWLQAVAPGSFQILVLRRGDRIIAGMPMVTNHNWGMMHVCMPPLTQALGVLLAPSKKTTYEGRLSEEMDTLRALVSAIPPFGRFSVNFHHQFTNWLPFYWAGYKQTTRYTYRLAESFDQTCLWANLQGETRTEIRKAEKCGLQIVVDDQIDRLWELTGRTFARQGFGVPYSRNLLGRLDQACKLRNARKILCAIGSDGRPHAAIYVVWDTKSAYYLIGGADSDLRSSGAQYWLMWQAILSLSGVAGAFDFEGSMIPSVERVFRSFGAVQTPYLSITQDNRTLPIRAAFALRSEAGRIMRRLGLRR